MNSIAKAAQKSLKAGSSMQRAIRDVLDSTMAESVKRSIICEAMGQFRAWAQDEFISLADDKRKARKQVNNVINDVSRTCRESDSKFSVRLKSRRDGYVYEATDPVPRASHELPILGMPSPKSESPDFSFEDITPEILTEFIARNPVAAMAEIFKQYSKDDVGEIMISAKKIVDES